MRYSSQGMGGIPVKKWRYSSQGMELLQLRSGGTPVKNGDIPVKEWSFVSQEMEVFKFSIPVKQ